MAEWFVPALPEQPKVFRPIPDRRSSKQFAFAYHLLARAVSKIATNESPATSNQISRRNAPQFFSDTLDRSPSRQHRSWKGNGHFDCVFGYRDSGVFHIIHRGTNDREFEGSRVVT